MQTETIQRIVIILIQFFSLFCTEKQFVIDASPGMNYHKHTVHTHVIKYTKITKACNCFCYCNIYIMQNQWLLEIHQMFTTTQEIAV